MILAGLVIDEDGLIVLEDGALSAFVPPSQYKDFKVYRLNSAEEGVPATYLGPDLVNGWHYLRVDAAGRAGLIPVSHWGTAPVRPGERLWGMGIAGKDFDCAAYYCTAYASLRREQPLWHCITQAPVSVPGGAVYNEAGQFVGWANGAYTENRIMSVNDEVYRVNLKNNSETDFFIEAADFLKNVGTIPTQVLGDPRPWLGLVGIRPVPKETADFMGLSNQGALIVSEVLVDGPADKAGMKPRDVIVGLNGKPLPRYKPDGVVQNWFERMFLATQPGGLLKLEVMRGQERLPIEITVGLAPKAIRAAERTYFEPLGLTVRELTLDDAITRRIEWPKAKGVFVTFVKSNSPGATAGLQPGDWIEEIDGVTVTSYAQGVELLNKVRDDTQRAEYVLLIRRGSETSVLRVKRR